MVRTIQTHVEILEVRASGEGPRTIIADERVALEVESDQRLVLSECLGSTQERVHMRRVGRQIM
jgi:hypothetical protein